MREGRIDIQSDPLLYRACAVDVKRHCSDIPFGRGKGKLLYKIIHSPSKLRRRSFFGNAL